MKNTSVIKIQGECEKSLTEVYKHHSSLSNSPQLVTSVAIITHVQICTKRAEKVLDVIGRYFFRKGEVENVISQSRSYSK